MGRQVQQRMTRRKSERVPKKACCGAQCSQVSSQLLVVYGRGSAGQHGMQGAQRRTRSTAVLPVSPMNWICRPEAACLQAAPPTAQVRAMGGGKGRAQGGGSGRLLSARLLLHTRRLGS